MDEVDEEATGERAGNVAKTEMDGNTKGTGGTILQEGKQKLWLVYASTRRVLRNKD